LALQAKAIGLSSTRSSLCRAALCALTLFASAALAKPRIAVSISQAKEVTETKNGVRSAHLVPAKSASSGDVVEYVLSYTNSGDEAATDAVIQDPIPRGTTYVADSASGEGAEISYSNDGGKTFAPAVKLTYEFKLPNGTTEKRVATPAEYTHIRWTVKRVAPGAGGKVSFRVKVN
jgi:uncharacterized repeat protein (TIGR01451 family)